MLYHAIRNYPSSLSKLYLRHTSTLTTLQAHLSHPKYRPDIDGLRAIAVLSVVGFHAFPKWFEGGFIGVDVFFVISGFLISTIIFESLDKGTFSFTQFYARRIRRIFPSLLLVLIVSFAFGWFSLLAAEYKQLGKHIAAGAGFVSNIVFWKEAGYFDNAASTKPLLHLWTLGIEEQFYIVWPLVLWLAWKRKINLLAITLLVSGVSFYLNIQGVKQDAVATFYSLQTRFWELASGSLLAWISNYKNATCTNVKTKVDDWLGALIYKHAPGSGNKILVNLLSVAGFLLLVYGFRYINENVSFPGAWALVPVLGTVILISAGSKAWINRTILSNRLAVWFGLISFPLYLWHWPLLSFATIMESEFPHRNIRIATVFLSIILAWLTFKLVEKPIRLGGHSKAKITILVALMAAVGLVGFNTYSSDGFKFRHKKLEPFVQQLSWPEYMIRRQECNDRYGTNFGQYCLNDNVTKDPEIILIGDSQANHLFEGLNLATPGKNLLMIGKGACPPFIGLSVRIAEGEQNCQSKLDATLKIIREHPSIRTVVISMMGAAYVNNKRGFKGGLAYLHETGKEITDDSARIFSEGMRRTLKVLLQQNKEIIFVISTPRLNFHPALCIKTRPLSIENKKLKEPCAMSKDLYLRDNKKYLDVVSNVLVDFPAVKVLDTTKALCDDEFCYAMLDGVLLYRDDVHLSLEGSKFIGNFFKATYSSNEL